jgi:prepilin-type N-terminal cleavage/methylation domain-containing protein
MKEKGASMEKITSTGKPFSISKLGNRRGFSLVEMAIVLVIIGVIIGAIVKGQDLIVNSRAKQVTSAASTWRNLAMAFMDRNGRLPGDGAKTGIIKSFAGYSSPTKEIMSTMTTAPPQPVTVGSMSFYVFFGNTTGDTTGRNVIVICKVADCQTAFTADEVEIIKAVDTAFDGSADAGIGQFRGAKTATITDGFAATFTDLNSTTAGTSTVWSTSFGAAVWAFDRPF